MTAASPAGVLVTGGAVAALDHTLRTARVPFAPIDPRQEATVAAWHRLHETSGDIDLPPSLRRRNEGCIGVPIDRRQAGLESWKLHIPRATMKAR